MNVQSGALWYQCASAVDNLAAYYFNNITMGEAPTSPAAIKLARHIAECPSLFPEVSHGHLQKYKFVVCWVSHIMH